MTHRGKVTRIVGKNEWQNVPLLVGGKNLPNALFRDLVQFEELTDYSLDGVGSENESNQSEKPPTPEKDNFSQKRKLRLKKQRALKRKLMKSLQADDKVKRKKVKEQYNDKPSQQSEDSLKENIIEPEEENFDHMTEWKNLFISDEVMKALSELGFTKPMPIQEKILPTAIRDKRDVLGAAETGSGKTLAFGIPLLHHLMADKDNSSVTSNGNSTQNSIQEECKEEDVSDLDEDLPETFNSLNHNKSLDTSKKVLPALILTPTRELALQIKKHLTSAAKYTGLWMSVVVGGMSSQKQTRLLDKKPDIVIATPGRLNEIVESGNSYLSNLHNLKYLVIDEADRMLEKGHFEDLTKLLDVINSRERNKKRQTYIFSATLTTVHNAPTRRNVKAEQFTKSGKLEKLMKQTGIQKKPYVVDLTTSKVTAEKLFEAKIVCQVAEKDFYLYYFLKSFPGRTLIFTNSIDCIFRLSGILEVLGCSPLHIHAKMQQRQRLKHLDRFQSNPSAVMIASDVAARGLDIADVKHVIHYQVPRTMETYIHRSGRAARSGKNGLSLLLVSPEEMLFYKRICHSLNKHEEGGKSDPGEIPLFWVDQNYMGAVRKRVNVARDIDKVSHAMKKANLHNDWFRKTAEAMEMDLDDDQLIHDDDGEEKKRDLASKKQQLNALLKKPIFPKGFSGKFITKRGTLLRPGLQNDDVYSHVSSSKSKKK